MKKTIAYLIITLFLVSFAAAQPVATTAKENKAIATRNIIAAKQNAEETPEECFSRLSESNPGADEEALKERCALKTATTTRLRAVEARKITQQKLIQARQTYAKAKERYQTARKNYITAQNNFREAKQKIGECKDEETEECSQLREQIRERAKESLSKTVDRIIEHLKKVRANVESNEDLTEEEASEIIEDIDKMISEIENAKSTIDSSEDKDKIIEASKRIKQAWLRIRKRLTIHTGRIVNARIGGVIVKVNQLEIKLEKILGRMKEKGMDTSEVESLVNEFNMKIEEAQTNYESALDKFKEAASAEDVETAHELAKEGHEYMKASHKALQEAQKLLRDIVLSIKQAGGQEDLTEVAEDDDA